MTKIIRACVTLTREEIEAADRLSEAKGLTRAALIGELIAKACPPDERKAVRDSRIGRGRPLA